MTVQSVSILYYAHMLFTVLTGKCIIMLYVRSIGQHAVSDRLKITSCYARREALWYFMIQKQDFLESETVLCGKNSVLLMV